MVVVIHLLSILELLSVQGTSCLAMCPQKFNVFYFWGVPYLGPMHPAVLGYAFFRGNRAMVVVVYPSSLPSLFLVESAIGLALDPT